MHGQRWRGLASRRRHESRMREGTWLTRRSGLRSIGTGPHPMLETMRERATSTATMSSSSIRNRGNASGAVATCSSRAGRTQPGVASSSGDLWVIEYVIFYDERPVPTVSIMEFRDGKVARETQYYADPFEAPAWRARWRDETKR